MLGIALLLCAMAADYIYNDQLYMTRLSNAIVYSSLDADPHRKYSGYTIEEMCENYPAPNASFEKVTIDVPIVDQYPELPVGCEITAASAVLQYLGYEDADKCSLVEKHMKLSSGSFYEADEVLYGPDPEYVFVGDPYGKGFGCNDKVIADAMNDFFKAHSSHNLAIVLNDTNSADLERLLDGGVPIIVWASIDMKPYRHFESSEWVSDKTGEDILWLANSHTLVLTGYDENFYYFMDPNDKDEIQRYMKTAFLTRWEERGCQSVAVKLTP